MKQTLQLECTYHLDCNHIAPCCLDSEKGHHQATRGTSTYHSRLFLLLMGYWATGEVPLLLELHELQNKLHMGQDEP